MAAANAILVPLQCEFFALEGLSQLIKTVEQVKATLNPTLTIHGIVLTMYDARNNLSNQVVKDVRDYMGRRSTTPYPAQCARVGGAVLRQAGNWSTISNASAAKPICGSRPRSFSAKRSCAL